VPRSIKFARSPWLADFADAIGVDWLGATVPFDSSIQPARAADPWSGSCYVKEKTLTVRAELGDRNG
jgi:hypothetical protein